MDIEFVTSGSDISEKSAFAVVVFEGAGLSGLAAELDQQAGGALGRALGQGRFTGGKGQVLDLVAPAGIKAGRVLLVGAGKADAFDDVAAEHVAASAYHAVKTSGLTTLRIAFADAAAARPERAALGARLASYRFDRYRTKEPADKKPSIGKVEVVSADPAKSREAFVPLVALADGVTFTRDLVSELRRLPVDVPTDAVLVITFSQPMDAASVEAALTLTKLTAARG